VTLHDPAHLLDHAAWLRSLASSLVGDRATADDLVQETYVAALRRPPSTERPVKPWLSRVLRNAARFRWRSETNRSAREAALASTADRETLTSAELLERHETQQLLARLVGELEEPYREAILLRFAEGLAPKDIARRLGIPAGTVRWRISEGLARLRARLDALHGGDRKAWLAALAPLVGRAPIGGVPVLVVAALVAIAAIVLVLAVGRRRAESTAPAHAPAPVAKLTVPRADVRVPAEEVRWLAQVGAPRRRIAGRVIDAAPAGGASTSTRDGAGQAGASNGSTRDGVPAIGVLVTLNQDAGVREQHTDRDGRFDFGLADPSELTVSAASPGKVTTIMHVDPRDPRTRTDDLEIALTPCVTSIYGFVRDVDGAPIAGARVLREDVFGATTDATGAYEVCALPTATETTGLLFVVRAEGYGAIHALPAPKGRVQRDFVLTPEATIAGRVIDEAGAAVAHARITVASDDDGTRGYDDISAPVVVMSDASGAFQASGLRGGRLLATAFAPDAVSAPAHVLVGPGDVHTVTLRVQATGVVRGRVTVAGRAAVGARVSVRGADIVAVAQSDGAFVLSRVPAGRAVLDVAGYRALAPIELDVRAGKDTTADIAVAALVTMRGTVRWRGAPVPHARVHMYGPSKLGATADGTGAYVLPGLEPGTYHLHSDDTRMGGYLEATVELPDVGEHVRDFDLTAGATVRGIVVDPSGVPLAGAFVALTLPGTGPATLPVGDLGECVTGADGRFVCGLMGGGGAYVPEVFASEAMRIPLRFAVAPAAIELRDANAVVDGVRFVVERSDLAIAGTVVDLGGAPIADASVQLFVERDIHRWAAVPQTITNARGAFRIPGLAAGTYALAVLTPDGIRYERAAVPAGTTNLAIVMDRSTCDGGGVVRDRLRAEPPEISARANGPVIWDDRVELAGWTAPAQVRAGETIELAVVYKVLRPLERTWKAFVHLDGPVRVNGDHDPLDGRCPTTTWRPGDFLVDRITMSATTAGRYDINIGFFRGRARSWINLPISAAPTAMRDSWGQLRIGQVIVGD
jgi:RNA polymerase sigma-70 factor (ECF subfamily)